MTKGLAVLLCLAFLVAGVIGQNGTTTNATTTTTTAATTTTANPATTTTAAPATTTSAPNTPSSPAAPVSNDDDDEFGQGGILILVFGGGVALALVIWMIYHAYHQLKQDREDELAKERKALEDEEMAMKPTKSMNLESMYSKSYGNGSIELVF